MSLNFLCQKWGQVHVVARDLSTLSLILTLQHKSKEAADFRVRAIETLKVLSDKGGSTQALYTRQLADAFGDQRKDTEALTLYKKALQLDEDRFGDQSPELVADLNSLASCSDTLHDYESAVRYSRRALKLVANSVGTGHPDYADQLEDLAKLLRRTKNFTEGEERYQAAIEIDKAAYGPKHPDVADLFRNLGLLLRDAKKFKEAEASHRSALEIYEHANPLNEREVALTLDYLALVVRDQGRLDEAISLFSRASAICEKSLDPADRLVERVKLNIEKTRAMQTNPNQH